MTESEFDPAERDSALIRLVDDEPDVRAALSLMLEIEGWRCVSYASAREFLVENMDSPGCLVLDVRMPGMSGLELQQAMEERGIELPVIFLTGHGDLDTAIQSLKRGAVDFLLKPVDDEKLLAAIASAVHKDRLRREGLSAELLKAGAKALSDRERHLLELISSARLTRVCLSSASLRRTVQGHAPEIYQEVRNSLGKVLEAIFARHHAPHRPDEVSPAVLRRRPPLSSSRTGRNRLPLTFSKLRA